jgi:hypothetical protein
MPTVGRMSPERLVAAQSPRSIYARQCRHLPANRLSRLVPDLQGHLDSFVRYIDSLDEEEQRKHDAKTIVQHSRCVLGLVTDQEFEENDALWQALFRIADVYDGYVFVHDSLLLPSGGVIVGPLRHHVDR